MLRIRRSEDRGHGKHGWLDSRHTFSFAGYFDPKFVGFHDLLVINEDRVAPGAGFGTHSHQEMEIISYVLGGAIEHRDSTGTGAVLRPGEVQRMTAGTGVSHSEYNASKTEPLHFLQIWILPDTPALKPSYEQRDFPAAERTDRLRLLGSKDARDGSVLIHQDVTLYGSLLGKEKSVEHTLGPGRVAWLQLVSGALKVQASSQSVELKTGDGLAIEEERALRLTAGEGSELLLFDLPGAPAKPR